MDNNIFEDDDFFPVETPNKEDNIDKEEYLNFDTNYENNIFNDVEEEKPKKRKNSIYNGLKVLPIMAFVFVSILGVYIFFNNVKADSKNLIRIEKNMKVGYIDTEGNEIVKPKFLYGSDFYKGYAIVKNYNDLFGVINGKGKNVIEFGNISSIELYSNRYIVSKITNDGLKTGLLDTNLKEVTRYIYDNINYHKSGLFSFVRDNTIGIMTKDGKVIYSYTVSEVDDKNISLEVSDITYSSYKDMYARVKINDSSTIINITTGKEVYEYTLDDINVLDNNVFYINKNDNKKYLIISNDEVIFESDSYKKVRVEDINSNIAIGTKKDGQVDYINLLTKEIINSDSSTKYTYSDGVVLKEKNNEYTVYTPKKILSTFKNVKPLNNTFVNNFMIITTKNNKYNFINKNGSIIGSKEYDNVNDFNEKGYAIVNKDNSYGVINSTGKEIIPIKYDEILFIDNDLFNTLSEKYQKELFIYKNNNNYGFIDSNNKIVLKANYDSFKTITTKYPFIKAKYNENYTLINLQTYNDLSIESDNIQIYDDCLTDMDSYYNYDGELLYTNKGEIDE